MRVVSLGLFLFLTWLLLSGHYTPLILGFGIASTALVILVAIRMDLIDREGHPIQLSPGFIGYWVWLVIEIVKANLDVAKRIWSPRLPISPILFRLKASQPSELGQVIYGNSITLTPGTVTVSLGEGSLLVHAIAEEVGEDLARGEMDRRVTALERPAS